jgi:3D (Asp-Asp-Asp) domain-containing protein
MNLTFDLPEPTDADLGAEWQLWGTYYYAQPAVESAAGIAIRNCAGEAVGPMISDRDWCLGAMEGTLVVTKRDGALVTYNYEGQASPRQTSCKAYFKQKSEEELEALEKTRFRIARGPYGDGSANFILSPYRTLAVDRKKIALGTALYISKARGEKITLPDGSPATHDGYFFAGDVGGAIKGAHVDFFLGVSLINPFTFVRSDEASSFAAREVVNTARASFLRAVHEI